jgi:hypothetical protein
MGGRIQATQTGITIRKRLLPHLRVLVLFSIVIHYIVLRVVCNLGYLNKAVLEGWNAFGATDPA